MPQKPFIWNFQGRRSLRLKDYDYSLSGTYFITICAYKKKPLFGTIDDGKMRLNRLGHIVRYEWKRVGKTRRNVALDAFIIMPNHLHMIVRIKNKPREPRLPNGARQSLARPDGLAANSIGSIIGVFKSSATKSIRRCIGDATMLIWQRNYWERIIPPEEDLWVIRQYIKKNPENWNRFAAHALDG